MNPRATATRSDFDLDFTEKGLPAEEWVRDLFGWPRVEVKAPDKFLIPDHRYGGRHLAFIEYESRNSGIYVPSGINTTKADYWALKFGVYPGAVIVHVDWLRAAFQIAAAKGQYQRCLLEPNPTRGVLVGIRELWEAKRP